MLNNRLIVITILVIIHSHAVTPNGPAIKLVVVPPAGGWRIFCSSFTAKNVINLLILLSVLAVAFVILKEVEQLSLSTSHAVPKRNSFLSVA